MSNFPTVWIFRKNENLWYLQPEMFHQAFTKLSVSFNLINIYIYRKPEPYLCSCLALRIRKHHPVSKYSKNLFLPKTTYTLFLNDYQ